MNMWGFSKSFMKEAEAVALAKKYARIYGIDPSEFLDGYTRGKLLVKITATDAVLGPGYGIFAGDQLQWATLRFSPERSRWVSTEFWHPAQKSHVDADGRCVLDVPYADHRELLMDILKHGTHGEVMAPKSLRRLVTDELAAMHKKYADTP